MPVVLGIALAGALGALARYGVDRALSRGPGGFPWAILVVNVTGSFALGLVVALFTGRVEVDPSLRTTVTVGFLGAYTTFSTLSLDTYRLIEEGSYGLALANGLGSLALGVLALSAGILLGRAF